jgi:hypothetical protein
MAISIVAEIGSTPWVVGPESSHAITDSIIYFRTFVIIARSVVVGTGSIIVRTCERSTDECAGEKSRSNAPSPSTVPMRGGFHRFKGYAERNYCSSGYD